jgi:hypothetical protein
MDVCGSWFGILGGGSNVDTNVGFGRMTTMVVASCMVNFFDCCGGQWLVVLLGHLLVGL